MTDSLSLKNRSLHEGTQAVSTILGLEDRLGDIESTSLTQMGSTLPTTAAVVGQLFIRTGATSPGLYRALDLVGNWSGPQ